MKNLIEYLEEYASREIELDPEDVTTNIYDICGGNYDDAYWSGVLDGKRSLAKDALDMLKNSS